MNYGLARLEELPLSLRLIREIHAELLQEGRGAQATPGTFRTSQNWIGPAGVSLDQATFVPPPVHEMHETLDNLERFLHHDEPLPVLIEAGLAHAQFETIHPFLDGNAASADCSSPSCSSTAGSCAAPCSTSATTSSCTARSTTTA